MKWYCMLPLILGWTFFQLAQGWDLAPIAQAIKACVKENGLDDTTGQVIFDIAARHITNYTAGSDLKILQNKVAYETDTFLNNIGQRGKFANISNCAALKLEPPKTAG